MRGPRAGPARRFRGPVLILASGKRITDPYSPLDAWMYDRLFAPTILEMVRPALEQFLGELPPGARVLDVGCGGGHIPIMLAQARADLQLTGIDLVEPQVLRARRRSVHLRERLHFELGDALDLRYPDASFDGVLSVTSVKHWQPRERGLAECLRVLRPGGPLLIAEVDRACTLDSVRRRILAPSALPRFLWPIALPMIRTFIFGRGVDLDECRALLADQPLEKVEVSRIPEHPGIVMRGRRLRR